MPDGLGLKGVRPQQMPDTVPGSHNKRQVGVGDPPLQTAAVAPGKDGLELAIGNLVIGCVLCVTIIGIPFGMQFFKIARLALFPFGARIVKITY